MASDQESKPPAGRLALLGALLALEVTAAVAFARVLQGGKPIAQLAFAAGLSVLLAAALERQQAQHRKEHGALQRGIHRC